jgi:hypothetical protein
MHQAQGRKNEAVADLDAALRMPEALRSEPGQKAVTQARHILDEIQGR